MENNGSAKKGSKPSGLGRDLSALLEDNDGIPNMESKVTLRREDGSHVKIYDKTGSDKKQGSSVKIKKN